MLEEPTSLRIDDPGVRALFTEAARFQSWLDVEAALAQAQAELGIIPAAAAREITGKAPLKCLDLGAGRRPAIRGCRSSGSWIAPARATRAATCTGERRRRT